MKATLLEEIFAFLNWADKRKAEPQGSVEMLNTWMIDGKPTALALQFSEKEAHLALNVLGKLPEKVGKGRRVVWLHEGREGRQLLTITRKEYVKPADDSRY